MELMQAKLDRLLTKTPYWFNVFSEQLVFTLQQVHQDWVPIPVLPRRLLPDTAAQTVLARWHELATTLREMRRSKREAQQLLDSIGVVLSYWARLQPLPSVD